MSNFYIFQLGHKALTFLRGSQLILTFLGLLFLGLFLHMVYIKHKLNVRKAENAILEDDIEAKHKLERKKTKLEKQKGKTLNYQILNKIKEYILKKLP